MAILKSIVMDTITQRKVCVQLKEALAVSLTSSNGPKLQFLIFHTA